MVRNNQLSTSTTSTTEARATNAFDQKSGNRSKATSNRNVAAKDKQSAKQDTGLTVIRKKPKSGTSIKNNKKLAKTRSSSLPPEKTNILSDDILISIKTRSAVKKSSLVRSDHSYANVCSGSSHSSSFNSS